MTFDEYKAAGLSDDDARVAADKDAVVDTSKKDAGVQRANFDEAIGKDPAEGPVADPVHERVSDAEDRLSDLELAVTLVIRHLDPLGTSHAFDALRRP